MKNLLLVGGSLALFMGVAVAQEYDQEVCDEERFGEYSDPRVCESPSLPMPHKSAT
jgi:opacity protein-like surface antigen